MKAGNLDRRVTLRRAALVDDGFSLVEVWADLGEPIPAARADVSDGEKWRAAQVQAAIGTRFTVRSDTLTRTITPRDRLQHEGREYTITGVREADGPRRAVLELSCVARADA